MNQDRLMYASFYYNPNLDKYLSLRLEKLELVKIVKLRIIYASPAVNFYLNLFQD